MFFKARGKPTRSKHAIYLIAATSLGLVLSFITHAVIEMGYLRWADSQGLLVPFYGGCALTPELQIGLWVAGAIGGFLFGRWGWQKVYIGCGHATTTIQVAARLRTVAAPLRGLNSFY